MMLTKKVSYYKYMRCLKVRTSRRQRQKISQLCNREKDVCILRELWRVSDVLLELEVE
jgi:hypothetical protein